MDIMTPIDQVSRGSAASDGPNRASSQARLREATEGDRPALLALHHAALHNLGRGYYTEAQIRSLLKHVPTLDASLIADRTYFVAELDDQIVACGGWSARTPGYASSSEPAGTDPDEPRAPLIRAMYVRPSHARRGLGRQILATAERAAMSRCGHPPELDALLGGVPLYLAAGYEPLGRSTWQLPDGEEIAIVRMRKRPSLLKAGTRTV